jgi:DNA topoisomerase III
LIDESVANDVATACKGQPATVTASQTEEKSTPAPLPFSLLDLQAHMSKKHGLSAQQTQDVTQSLRENHKAITYNRSDCNYLTSEQFGDANPAQKGRAFDDKKVSAHTAIIPTTTAPNPANMTVDDRQVYQAIAAQYLAQFLPEKRYLAASATFVVNGHVFVAKATQTTQDGWTTLLSATEDSES